MSSTITIEQLNETISSALERSAFVFAEPADAADVAVLPAPLGYARIKTTGSVSGELHLSASEGFLRELAASLLGVEPEEVDPAAHGADALKEMANMIAGSVVLCCDGENRAYHLGLPELSDRARFEAAMRTGLSTTMVTNGEPLQVVWVNGGESVKAAA